MWSIRTPSVLLVSSALGVMLGLALVRTPAFFAASVLVVAGAGLVLTTSRWLTRGLPDVDRRREQVFSLVVLASHMVIGLGINASRTVTNYIGPDAVGYHRDAIALLAHWRNGNPSPLLPSGKEGFYYSLARLYGVFGPHKAAALAVVAICAALVLPITADTTRRLFGVGPDRRAHALLLVLPAFLVWTSHLLREAPIVLCIAILVNCAVRLSQRASVAAVVITAATGGVLLTLRANVGFILLGALIVGVMFGRRDLIQGISTAGATIGVVALLVLAGGLGLRGYQLVANTDLQDVSNLRSDLATTANSGFQDEADVSTTRGALGYLVVGLPTFFLGPFPWQVGGVRQVPGMLEAMTIWFLIPSLVRGIRRSWELVRRQTLAILLPGLLLALALALSTGNFGIIVRERLQVLVVLLPLIALGRTPAVDVGLHGQPEKRDEDGDGAGDGSPERHPAAAYHDRQAP